MESIGGPEPLEDKSFKSISDPALRRILKKVDVFIVNKRITAINPAKPIDVINGAVEFIDDRIIDPPTMHKLQVHVKNCNIIPRITVPRGMKSDKAITAAYGPDGVRAFATLAYLLKNRLYRGEGTLMWVSFKGIEAEAREALGNNYLAKIISDPPPPGPRLNSQFRLPE